MPVTFHGKSRARLRSLARVPRACLLRLCSGSDRSIAESERMDYACNPTERIAPMVTLPLRTAVSYATVIDGPDVAAFAVRETAPAAAPKPRLLDRVREAIRTRHYSRRTEKTYVAWIRRYIFFHGKRHPADMGAAEIKQFLSSLAVQDNVAASTQNQALSALLFLYRQVARAGSPVARRRRPREAGRPSSRRLEPWRGASGSP